MLSKCFSKRYSILVNIHTPKTTLKVFCLQHSPIILIIVSVFMNEILKEIPFYMDYSMSCFNILTEITKTQNIRLVYPISNQRYMCCICWIKQITKIHEAACWNKYFKRLFDILLAHVRYMYHSRPVALNLCCRSVSILKSHK